jgi:1-acyl-sn-glycerol-3-phosphate acyltransferase
MSLCLGFSKMQRTILETPVFASIARGGAKLFLWLTGWRLVGPPPPVPKAVVTAAPHTSNWDFIYSMAICWSANANVYWMGKDAMFVFGFGWLMKWLGGIPVDRSRGHNVAKQALQAFKNSERLLVIIPPEGTRSRVNGWKRGFYLIARGAKVPVVCGYLDFAKKEGGFGPTIYPTGDVEADILEMEAFYKTITGKHPELTSPALPQPEHEFAQGHKL